ncbi:NADH-quinone oxidoreductase subunit A [Alicyclobacillus contaminans]|uniref:NADH-quinone oxidoreductase subunit A n=1 Tax=Alicyclobacillus contaminans TaxID=392016 RepID=UPI0004294DF9|nr:NADH-quinone oxidoreductase subunit A [Alicyclobacillus contaminans]GMA50937.1 NADH-quinone oxidoreductase subunit A [Alicyclobacillus contaminans]
MAHLFQAWNNELFLVIFLILGILLPVGALWVLGPMLRPARPNDAKRTTYESGVQPFGDAHVRYHARYYLFALLFVVFDVETLFLYPWAASFHQLGRFAFVEMIIFLFLLVIGLVYAWRKKVLEWNE